MSAFEQTKTEFTFVSARPQLAELNTRLQQTCPDYRMTLEPYRFVNTTTMAVYDPESSKSTYDIILCLNKDSRCISSVVGRYNASLRSMELLSKTEPEYEGRKFNLYLRTVFIWLMTYSRPSVAKIFSHSMNPISTYAMYKHFGATNQELIEFIGPRNLTPETFTLTEAKEFHTYYKEQHDQDAKNNAETKFEEMLNHGIELIIDLGQIPEDEVECMSREEQVSVIFGKTEDEAIEDIKSNMDGYAITLMIEISDNDSINDTMREILLDKLRSMKIDCSDKDPVAKRTRAAKHGKESTCKRPRGGAKTKKAKKSKKSKSRKSRQR